MKARFRMRFTFWLDLHKGDEAALAETIDALKTERTFAATVRDGIRLMVDLRAGRVGVLYELFPQLRTALAPAPTASEDFERMVAAAVDSALSKQGRALPMRAGVENSAPTVVVAASQTKATDVAKNFLDSMKTISGGWFN